MKKGELKMKQDQNQKQKPKAKFSDANGNVYSLMGIARKALVRNGQKAEAEEMIKKVHEEARDYEHAQEIMREYVEVV